MPQKKTRIVVCPECGTLYDIHYVGKVKTRKKYGKEYIEKFECKNCGMVNAVFKDLETLGLKDGS